jgi:pimeloyl-ACP methyl ester carboxylesterase
VKASLLFALLVASFTPAFAAEVPAAPNRFASAIAPAERFEVQGMLVERHGNGGSAGRPLILIPGLAAGGWVWQETVREFAASHAVYVVTLPGFDGRPAVEGNPFEAARAALKELVISRRLADPVLVGHSLGATLAVALAEELPGRIGGVAAWVGAVLALDLRPGLSKIAAPVLVLAPFYGPDSAATGAISAADKVAYYRELMTGTPKLEVAPIDNARHFAMLDQPQAVHAALRQFLKTL